MAVIHFINSKRPQTKQSLSAVLAYTMKKQKTVWGNRFLVSGVNCSPQTAYQEFINTKLLHRKTNGRQYYHFVQSFPVWEDIDSQTAHEIALKFAETFKGYEIVVATHTDRDHIHSHFILNSVNMETGRKFHISQRDLEGLMKISDKIVSYYGFSVCVPKKEKDEHSISNGEYYAMQKNESWKLKLIFEIEACMKQAKTKDHFMWLMEQEGYAVNWKEERQYITYTLPDGKKCRDKKLIEKKFLKEAMEHEFRIRQKILYGFENTGKEPAAVGGTGRNNVYHYRNQLESTASITADAAGMYGESDGTAGIVDAGTAETSHIRGYGSYAMAAGQPFEERISGTSRDGEQLAEEITGELQAGEQRAEQTGWESERAEFEILIRTGKQHEIYTSDFVLDFSDSDSIGSHSDITEEQEEQNISM